MAASACGAKQVGACENGERGKGEAELQEPAAGELSLEFGHAESLSHLPERRLVFRDSGLGRDRVSAELVGALPSVLAGGGFASVMVSWIPSGEDMTAVPRGWLEGSGCDAWLLHTQTDDALRAAAGWNRDAPSTEEFSERMERWLEYYRVEGIEKIAYGTIVLRRRESARNWLRTSMLPKRVLRPAGHHLERLFSAQDVLERTPSDELLLRERFVVAADVELEQRLRQESGRWTLRGAELQLDGGLGFTAGLDEYSTKVVTALDPSRPLGETLGEAAAALGVDRDEFAAAGAALIRQMLELGFVVPAEAGP